MSGPSLVGMKCCRTIHRQQAQGAGTDLPAIHYTSAFERALRGPEGTQHKKEKCVWLRNGTSQRSSKAPHRASVLRPAAKLQPWALSCATQTDDCLWQLEGAKYLRVLTETSVAVASGTSEARGEPRPKLGQPGKCIRKPEELRIVLKRETAFSGNRNH